MEGIVALGLAILSIPFVLPLMVSPPVFWSVPGLAAVLIALIVRLVRREAV